MGVTCTICNFNLRSSPSDLQFRHHRTMFLQVVLYAVGGVLLLVAAVFACVTAYLTYIYWKYSHLPSPKRPGFFFGHFWDIIKLYKETGNDELPIADVMFKWAMDVKKPLFVVFLFGAPWIITTDPNYVKEMSMKPLHDKAKSLLKNLQTSFGERLMGEGLVTTFDYETWQPKRKLYDPCFKQNYLRGLIPAFNECVDKFLQKLKPLADGSTSVPMAEHFAEVTLDVISKVAFGSDFSEIYEKSKGTGKRTSLVTSIMKGMGVSYKTLSVTLYQWLHPSEVQGYKESVRGLRKIGRDCIEERIAAIRRGEQIPNDILSQILQVAATKVNEDLEVLVDDFVTFYIGGQETTANLLSFVTAQIHLDPNILERLQTEVDEVLGDKDTVSAEDLAKLEYTEQVLLECLRTNPPFMGIIKCARTGISLGEHYIPAGTVVILPTAAMCRMPEYFDDPEVFNPSRFDPENIRPNPFVYFPFGLGHRSCIGKHFALIEAKIILARLLQQFKLMIPPDYKIVAIARGATKLKGDLSCILEQRK